MAVTENVLSDPERVPRSLVETYFEERGRGWVCDVDGVLVGFSFADATDHSIFGLFVLPGHEGQGIGKRLLDMAVAWLFDQGAEAIRLTTGPGTRADAFYQRQGWERGALDERGEVRFVLRSKP